ncbi:MAG: hypothetical protein JWQ09_2978 [Segetibacter sp.]|nr:hypothetical protein [Segetibacter sp.]
MTNQGVNENNTNENRAKPSAIIPEQQNLQVEEPIEEKEMAKKLKVCRQHLAGLRIEGKIPYIPAGRRRVLYQPSEVIGALKVLPTAKAQ